VSETEGPGPKADEVTYDNKSSAYYRFDFALPPSAREITMTIDMIMADQGVVFLNGHRLTGMMAPPLADCNPPTAQCYLDLDYALAGPPLNMDVTDPNGDLIIAWPRPYQLTITPDDELWQTFFRAGRNELVFAVMGDASPWDPTGLEFAARIDFTGTSIVAAECYFDEDPGEGLGIALQAEDGAFDSFEERLDIDVTTPGDLCPGYHTLYVRTKSCEGVWGLPRPHRFVVEGESAVVSGEYAVDADPAGEGVTGVPFSAPELGPGGYKFLAELDTSGLALGMHTLFVRVRDQWGTWGPARQYRFEVSPAATIVKTEFFIDEDPGPGMGIELPAKDGSFDSAAEDLLVEAHSVAGLDLGLHGLFVRAQDSYGRWSSPVASLNFSVVEIAAGYVDWASAAGLTGDDADPMAMPFSDGVENILKYAFNMTADGPDSSVLTSGTGTSGLPLITLSQTATDCEVRYEYLRRKDSGLIYEAVTTRDLETAWEVAEGSETVETIDLEWERVVFVTSFDRDDCPSLFATVRVSFE
jgi:hypothetical protein